MWLESELKVLCYDISLSQVQWLFVVSDVAWKIKIKTPQYKVFPHFQWSEQAQSLNCSHKQVDRQRRKNNHN